MTTQRMTEDWAVRSTEDQEAWIVVVPQRVQCDCTCPSCKGWRTEMVAHSSGKRFDEESDAWEWIEQMADSYEEMMDQYIEENSYQIAQMERYELWRQEY